MTFVESKIDQRKTHETVNKGHHIHTPYTIPNGTIGELTENKNREHVTYQYVVTFTKPLEIHKNLHVHRQIFNTLDEVYAAYEPILPDLQV